MVEGARTALRTLILLLSLNEEPLLTNQSRPAPFLAQPLHGPAYHYDLRPTVHGPCANRRADHTRSLTARTQAILALASSTYYYAFFTENFALERGTYGQQPLVAPKFLLGAFSQWRKVQVCWRSQNSEAFKLRSLRVHYLM